MMKLKGWLRKQEENVQEDNPSHNCFSAFILKIENANIPFYDLSLLLSHAFQSLFRGPEMLVSVCKSIFTI